MRSCVRTCCLLISLMVGTLISASASERETKVEQRHCPCRQITSGIGINQKECKTNIQYIIYQLYIQLERTPILNSNLFLSCCSFAFKLKIYRTAVVVKKTLNMPPEGVFQLWVDHRNLLKTKVKTPHAITTVG